MEEKHWVESYMEEYNTWEDLVKHEIEVKLDDYLGTSEYGCDLAYKLFEGENIDGSYTYSSYWSKELIKKYFDDFSDIYEELQFEYGGDFKVNMFDEPEKFIVIMLLETANSILSKCKIVDRNWNNNMTLDEDTIETIKSEM